MANGGWDSFETANLFHFLSSINIKILIDRLSAIHFQGSFIRFVSC